MIQRIKLCGWCLAKNHCPGTGALYSRVLGACNSWGLRSLKLRACYMMYAIRNMFQDEKAWPNSSLHAHIPSVNFATIFPPFPEEKIVVAILDILDGKLAERWYPRPSMNSGWFTWRVCVIFKKPPKVWVLLPHWSEVHCSALQCVTVCWCELQCVAVCCSVLQYDDTRRIGRE